MGVGGTPSDVSDEVIREWSEGLLESHIRLGVKDMGPNRSHSSTRPGERNNCLEETLYAPMIVNHREEKKELLPDDVTYNQTWWCQYCKDHNLDPKSGKVLNSKFLYCNPLF